MISQRGKSESRILNIGSSDKKFNKVIKRFIMESHPYVASALKESRLNLESF